MSKINPNELFDRVAAGSTFPQLAAVLRIATEPAKNYVQALLRQRDTTRIEAVFGYIDAHAHDGVIPTAEFDAAYAFMARLTLPQYRLLQAWVDRWNEYRHSKDRAALQAPEFEVFARLHGLTPQRLRWRIEPIKLEERVEWGERQFILLRRAYLARFSNMHTANVPFTLLSEKRRYLHALFCQGLRAGEIARKSNVTVQSVRKQLRRLCNILDTLPAVLVLEHIAGQPDDELPLSAAWTRHLQTSSEQRQLAIQYLRLWQLYMLKKAQGQTVPAPTSLHLPDGTTYANEGEVAHALRGAYGEAYPHTVGVLRWCWLAQRYAQIHGLPAE